MTAKMELGRAGGDFKGNVADLLLCQVHPTNLRGRGG